MSIKNYVSDSISNNPERYAIDGGDLPLINDYFVCQKWSPLIREQHLAIASLIRTRITILKNNPLDMRKRFKPKEDPSQTDIYSMIGDATIETYGVKSGQEVKKVLGYFDRHPGNTTKSNSVIKKSIRGNIATESIDLSKFIWGICKSKMVTKYLYKARPQHKQKNKVVTK